MFDEIQTGSSVFAVLQLIVVVATIAFIATTLVPELLTQVMSLID